MKALEMLLKGSLTQESASDRLALWCCQSGLLYYILQICLISAWHFSSKHPWMPFGPFTIHNSAKLPLAPFQGMQIPTQDSTITEPFTGQVFQKSTAVQAQSSPPLSPPRGISHTTVIKEMILWPPVTIKHSDTKNFREATCFGVKRLNLSGSSCFLVFLLQHPPEPEPVGGTQTAHSGHLASTWEQILSIRERPEAAKDGALKTPTVDGPVQEEDPAEAAEEKFQRKERI